MRTKLTFFLLLSLALNTFIPLTVIAARNVTKKDDEVETRMRDIDIRIGVIQGLLDLNTKEGNLAAQKKINELIPVLDNTLSFLEGMLAVTKSLKTPAAKKSVANLNDKVSNLNRIKTSLIAAQQTIATQVNSSPSRPRTTLTTPSTEALAEASPSVDNTPEPDPETTPEETPTQTPAPKPTPSPIQISVTDVPETGDTVLVARVLNFDANTAAKKLKSPTMKIKAGSDEVKTVPLQKIADGSAEAKLSLGRELQAGETIIYQILDGETEVTRETLTVFTPIDATRGGLFAVMGGGIVASKQAQTTNEAAPFTFFQAGYGSKVFGIKKDDLKLDGVTKVQTNLDFSKCNDQKIKDSFNDPRKKDSISAKLTYNKLILNLGTPNSSIEFTRASRGNDFDIKDDVYKNGTCEIMLDPSYTPFTGRNTGRISFRYQGLFSTESRASLAFPITAELPTNQPNRPFPFLNNRQTFSSEITTWWEFRPLSQFSFGPYVTLGASTLLESAIKDKESIFDRETNQEVQSRVVTPVGTKFYGEIGVMQHLKFNPGKFFVQNFAGFGYYDQFRNAAYKFNDTPCTDNGMDCPDRDLIGATRFRFVDKLRIFPYGFNPNMGRQVTVAPMFGVDLNVGKGPDNVRFFTGFVVNLGRFAGAPSQEQEQ